MNFELIMQLQQKPDPFTPGEPLFWDDPHISAQMLKWHLDPDNDVASRRPETIQRTVDWLVAALGLQAGDSVLDMGCGPGLYTSRLAEKGLRVTGVDYSRRSIAYATQYASEHHLDISYRYQNYLTLGDESQYEAILLIYGDFCPLSPEQRAKLLGNVQRALKPGGYFVLDVSTPILRQKHGNKNGWYAVETGFWKPGPHLVLEEGFAYPEQSIFLDQYIVIEASGQISVYRNWFQDFSRETITTELEQAGFVVQNVWNDLLGTPFTEDTEWIGLVAQKPDRIELPSESFCHPPKKGCV
ncbi:MAG TPA: class I SAM-dependent methyltransferase [Anaerolineae bacterium]|nr:class I SAM-dependent methyltransferase [Anaerolineae bacterium]HQI85629.1 class I SAM-dependent methyltransferase [Anaerolineae bacterium]